MKKALCLALALACLFLGGCGRRVELAFMAVCLGVDAAENGVTLTVKCPSYAGDQNQERSDYTVLSAGGGGWAQAVSALYAAAPVPPQFSQLREVIISRDSFRHIPAAQLLDLIDQLRGLRAHALVVVCPENAQAAVEAVEPQIGKRLSKYLDFTLSHVEEQGMIPATSLSSALRDAAAGWRDPVLAYADGGGLAGGYALGGLENLPLSSREVQLYRLLRGESQSLLLAFGGGSYGVSARGAAKRRVEDGALILEAPVYFTYSLYENPPGPGAGEALEQEIAALLRRLQAAGCDALGFGCQAARRYGTLEAWRQSGWPRQYREAEIRVRVDFRCRQQPLI